MFTAKITSLEPECKCGCTVSLYLYCCVFQAEFRELLLRALRKKEEDSRLPRKRHCLLMKTGIPHLLPFKACIPALLLITCPLCCLDHDIVSPGAFLEMQNLRPRHRRTESKLHLKIPQVMQGQSRIFSPPTAGYTF